MSKTRTIYIVYTEKFGESQFVFDDKFKLIDGWQMNDANYRHEYMSGFLAKLGIKVERNLPMKTKEEIAKKNEIINAAGKELWGLEENDE